MKQSISGSRGPNPPNGRGPMNFSAKTLNFLSFLSLASLAIHIRTYFKNNDVKNITKTKTYTSNVTSLRISLLARSPSRVNDWSVD